MLFSESAVYWVSETTVAVVYSLAYHHCLGQVRLAVKNSSSVEQQVNESRVVIRNWLTKKLDISDGGMVAFNAIRVLFCQ